MNFTSTKSGAYPKFTFNDVFINHWFNIIHNYKVSIPVNYYEASK